MVEENAIYYTIWYNYICPSIINGTRKSHLVHYIVTEIVILFPYTHITKENAILCVFTHIYAPL